MKISKKRKVDPQDSEAAKKPEPKTKRLRAPAQPNHPTGVEKLPEGTSNPSKNDKSPLDGDKAMVVEEGASVETVTEGSKIGSSTQEKKGKIESSL